MTSLPQKSDFWPLGLAKDNLEVSELPSLKEVQGRISFLKDANINRETCPWEHYNWGMAAWLTASASSPGLSDDARSVHPALPPATNLASLLSRRSRRFFISSPMSEEVAAKLDDTARILTSNRSWLSIYAVNCMVENQIGHVRLIRSNPEKYDYIGIARLTELKSAINGMWWIAGSGIAFFFVIEVTKAASAIRHQSRGYISALMEVGRVAQVMLDQACALGLGGWMTPAIRETDAHKLLRLDPICEEPVYFLRIGEPNDQVWEYER